MRNLSPTSKQFIKLLKKANTKLKYWLRLKRNHHKLRYFILLFLLLGALMGLRLQTVQANHLHVKLIKTLLQAQTTRVELLKVKTTTSSQLNAKNAALQQENAQIQSLQQQLQAKALLKKVVNQVASAVVPQVAAAPVSGCGDNTYANYIYEHESGCSTTITNASGCLGIGQACPGAKLLAVCADLDYTCENSFFTSYALARYGSWENAYNYWLAHHYW